MDREDLKKLSKEQEKVYSSVKDEVLKERLNDFIHMITIQAQPLHVSFLTIRERNKVMGKEVVCSTLTSLLVQSTSSLDEALGYLTTMREKIIRADRIISKH